MIYVIGSGPTGVSAAAALLGEGHQVTILDIGNILEPSVEEARKKLAQNEPDAWRAGETEILKKGMTAGAGGIPLKLAFGSDYPYRGSKKFSPFESHDMEARPSLGRGGFSSVWGASVLPYSTKDLSGWPVSFSELEPHFNAVSKMMGVSSHRDGISSRFPFKGTDAPPPPLSQQAKALLDDLDKNSVALEEAGIHFGRSRLALAPNCRACALCMYGCPFHLIYNSSLTLTELERNKNFRYLSGIAIREWKESANGVQIHALNTKTNEPALFDATRLLVAAGPLASTRLVLQSRGEAGKVIRMLDSQYFLFPMLRFRGTKGVEKEKLHTLSQAFLEIDNPGVDPHNIHLQLYTFNELYAQALSAKAGRWRSLLSPIFKVLLSRLIVVQGYLHSDSSAQISLRLGDRPNAEGIFPLVCEGEVNRNSTKVIARLMKMLKNLSFSLRAVPLKGQLKIASPGRGFHVGGSFPMRSNPGPWETDTLGRFSFWRRVHLVDSSVFPTVPAATITLTATANARRIALGISEELK